MRIPYDLMRDGFSSIREAANEMATAQQQVSTGRRLNSVGDDPLAAQRAIGERAGIAGIDAYTRTVNTASARLSSADAILSAIGDKLGAAVIAGLGAKGSTATASARAAAAAQVTSLRDALLSDFNSQLDGDSLFAGTRADAQAFANVGGAWTYQGNADRTQLEVNSGQKVSVSFDGQSIAQGGDASNVFSVLDDLQTAINAGDDAGIGTAIAGLERAVDRVLRAQGSLGADESGLDVTSSRLSTLRTAAENRRSNLEDVNMSEAVARLSAADTGYRAALAAVSTVERVSLLDYLR